MEVVVTPDPSSFAAELVAPHVRPGAALGLATGRTMEPIYAQLRGLDWTGVTTFNLDEYVGQTTFRDQMHAWLFQHVNAAPRFLDGLAPDPREECERFERALPPIDLQLLGLGENAHIAFNEPGSAFSSLTRPSRLENGTPVLTMGIATILRAKRIVLVATGERKAKAVRAMLHGPVTERVPATALRAHPNVTVVVDDAAHR